MAFDLGGKKLIRKAEGYLLSACFRQDVRQSFTDSFIHSVYLLVCCSGSVFTCSGLITSREVSVFHPEQPQRGKNNDRKEK